MANLRFVDRFNTENIFTCNDFKVRQHGIPPKRVLYYLLLIPVTVIFTTTKTLNSPDADFTQHDEVLLFIILIGILISIISLISVLVIRRVRNIIMTTEFQNMLFSNAMSLENNFFMMINSNKELLYYDRKIADIFPKQPDKDPDYLELLLDYEGIKEKDRIEMAQAILGSQPITIKCTIMLGKNKGKKITILVDPLPRPSKGYLLIRGKN